MLTKTIHKIESIIDIASIVHDYPVPIAAFDKLRAELRLVGVTQATIFPDLAGLCAKYKLIVWEPSDRRQQSSANDSRCPELNVCAETAKWYSLMRNP